MPIKTAEVWCNSMCFLSFNKEQQTDSQQSFSKKPQTDTRACDTSDIINYRKSVAPTGHQYNYRNYSQWLEQCGKDVHPEGCAQVQKLFASVKAEVQQYFGVTADFSDEEYCNLAAWVAVEAWNNHGLFGYSYGNVYVDIKSVTYFNCSIFTMLFYEERGIYAFILDKAHFNAIKREELRQLSEKTGIRLHIYLKLEPILPREEIVLESDESSPFALWNVVDEQFYAVIRQDRVTREIEDGYPIDVYGYSERLEALQKTPELSALEKQLTAASE